MMKTFSQITGQFDFIHNSKVFEKNFFQQLHQYVLDNKLLFNGQCGFREDCSTEYASLELIDRIIVEIDKNNTPVNILLDLSKAFDTLDHNILLDKLKYYELDGVSLKPMESYITGRKQYVNIDDTDFEVLTLKTGFPLGSIIGPLFFVIYITDIVRASNIFDFTIYADDTTLSTTLEIVLRNTQTLDTESKLNNKLM